MKKILLFILVIFISQLSYSQVFTYQCDKILKPYPDNCQYYIQVCYSRDYTQGLFAKLFLINVDGTETELGAPQSNGCQCDNGGFDGKGTGLLSPATYRFEMWAYGVGIDPHKVWEKIYADNAFCDFGLTAKNSANNYLVCNGAEIKCGISGGTCSDIKLELFKVVNNEFIAISSTTLLKGSGAREFKFGSLESGLYSVTATSMNIPNCFKIAEVEILNCPTPIITGTVTTANSVSLLVQNSACEKLIARCRSANGVVRTGTGSGNSVTILNLRPNTRYQGAIVNQCSSNPSILSARTNFSFTTNAADIVSSNDMNAITKNSLEIYPNPANNILNIEGLQYKTGEVTIQLQSIQGSVLKQLQIQASDKISKYQMDISQIQNGIYLLVLLNDKGKKITEKVTIQH